MRILIIGGVAAGMSAASKIKRINPDAEVIVYEKGQFVSYGACGMPYYISGENDDYRKLIARPKEEFEEKGIKIHLRHEVVKVIPEEKVIHIKDLEGNKLIQDTYDKLMIATGTYAKLPPIPGKELGNIHVLKTLDDGLLLKELVDQPRIKDVVIVGGGFVGIEAAEAFRYKGKNVKIIEHGERILKTFDPEMTEMAQEELIKHGVELHFGEKVEGLIGHTNVEGVKTDKATHKADLVLVSIGIKPATDFLHGTGIHFAKNGAILVDREMRTNIEDIYAAGDCTLVYNRVMEENQFIPLGTTANKCGRIAGSNILGSHIKFVGTLGSAAIKVFDIEMGRTGMTEQDAKRNAIEYTTSFIKTMVHPRYYPDSTPIWIKLICDKRTRVILGAQALGNKGAVLRIDVFAVAIHNKMTVDELGMTDLCYAPPFSGVWDAIHIASNAVK
jgi:NADPH-dependent 2,4-dienoyl-CoA reductase/sulfur reductase-like enzyme